MERDTDARDVLIRPSRASERAQANAALIPVETNDSEGRVTSGRVPVKIGHGGGRPI